MLCAQTVTVLHCYMVFSAFNYKRIQEFLPLIKRTLYITKLTTFGSHLPRRLCVAPPWEANSTCRMPCSSLSFRTSSIHPSIHPKGRNERLLFCKRDSAQAQRGINRCVLSFTPTSGTSMRWMHKKHLFLRLFHRFTSYLCKIIKTWTVASLISPPAIKKFMNIFSTTSMASGFVDAFQFLFQQIERPWPWLENMVELQIWY